MDLVVNRKRLALPNTFDEIVINESNTEQNVNIFFEPDLGDIYLKKLPANEEEIYCEPDNVLNKAHPDSQSHDTVKVKL